MGAASADYPGRGYVLIGMLLFLPLFDGRWRPPAIPHSRSHYISWCALLAAAALLLVWQPLQLGFTVITLLTAALPEEWFFRAYFMPRLGAGFRANLISSTFFSLLHGLTWGWTTALMVFAPSLMYGWLYQKTRDLMLVVLAHTLSNLFYVTVLDRFLAAFAVRAQTG